MDNLLIVGASSGVGLLLARRLLNSHNLWTASRRSPDLGNDVRHVEWDAIKDDFPTDFLPQQLSGVVYCPGSIRLQPFDRLSETSFIEDFDVNLMGAVRTLKMALPALKAAPHASVVLFSTVAVATGMPMHASIASAKGAVEGLTRSLAAEFAPRIRVNAIAPSLTDTPLADKLLRTDKQRTAAADRHPLERIGKSDDLAAVAQFLLSDEASWVTGQVIAVDGGLGSLRRFG